MEIQAGRLQAAKTAFYAIRPENLRVRRDGIRGRVRRIRRPRGAALYKLDR